MNTNNNHRYYKPIQERYFKLGDGEEGSLRQVSDDVSWCIHAARKIIEHEFGDEYSVKNPKMVSDIAGLIINTTTKINAQ